jgi:glycosyltransferase involved in cell wall biosynthesis
MSHPTAAPPPRVLVLLSTFQGEAFVVEQLQSILQQLPQGGHIRVRDDGSRDRTVALVQALNDARISVETGANLGFGASFLTLLQQAPADVDMVMFADQDDVWLPGKIGRAWDHLRQVNGQPALYGSAQMLADAQLHPLHATPPWPRGPSFENALCENIITGCTAALNREAVVLLQKGGVPAGVHFHDWWMYLVISAFGTVIFDDQPTLLYRQHGGNQIGHGAGKFGRHLGIVRFLMRRDWMGILLHQVHAFMEHYGERLEPAQQRWIGELFDHRPGHCQPQWKLVLGGLRLRQRPEGDWALRVLVAAYLLHLWPLPGRRLPAPSPPAGPAATASS